MTWRMMRNLAALFGLVVAAVAWQDFRERRVGQMVLDVLLLVCAVSMIRYAHAQRHLDDLP